LPVFARILLIFRFLKGIRERCK